MPLGFPYAHPECFSRPFSDLKPVLYDQLHLIELNLLGFGGLLDSP